MKKDKMNAQSRQEEADKVEATVYDGGPVRVVTAEDIANDDRLVGASVVVGQLYDFSNLPHVQDGRTADDVKKYNQAHILHGTNEKVLAPFTSEAERVKLGFSPDAEAGDKIITDPETGHMEEVSKDKLTK